MEVMKAILLLASLVLALSGAHAAEIYKYLDENGNVQYTDKPPTLPAQRLQIRNQPTDPAAVQEREQAEQRRRAEADSQRQEQARAAADTQQAEQLTAEDKAKRCLQARERYDTYMNSQKLYEQLPDGERRYLSSQELDATRAAAKATMEVMCQ